MFSETDAEKIARRETWIENSLKRWSKIRYAIAAVFIRVLPRCFGVGNKRGVFALLTRYALTFAIASTPFWVSYFKDSQSFSLNFAIWATVALATLMFSSGVVDLVWFDRKTDTRILRLRQSIAAFEATLHRDIANIVRPADHVTDDKETVILQRILAAMADEARAHLKIFDENTVQATLLLFDDENATSFICRARARSSRPTGQKVSCIDSIAYFWLQRFPDRASTVHDIRKQDAFPLRLSDGPEAGGYRSILSLPLVERADNSSVHRLRGVITLDSKRRYEFWGARRQELEALLEPHIRWIMAITDNHPHIKQIERRA